MKCGRASFAEKHVKNGEETGKILREMGETYSLIIVGKGGRGHSSMLIGLTDWEGCPELGTVGNLLASSELSISGSVLVIQQYRNHLNEKHDDDL